MLPISHCDCCGFLLDGLRSDDCPRCGYPVNSLKEQRFLETSLCDLERVARYGGAKLTISLLIHRYRQRLNSLQQLAVQPISQPTKQEVAPRPQLSMPGLQSMLAKPTAPLPPLPVNKPPAASIDNGPNRSVAPDYTHLPPLVVPVLQVTTPVVHPVALVPVESGQAFSLKSFFADQTINIVASLGAFLILVGSLSFIATTTNLLWSFLVMFLVHAIFGVIGVVSYRFRSFRTVAAIYTAIYALLVPLVGFSAYRLIAGQVITLSTPTLIAIAAAYAALVYGALAIYQKFQPFGYMAVTALVVADLAATFSFTIGYWWLPSALMLLALPALISVAPKQQIPWPFQGAGEILRLPLLVMTIVCMVVGSLFLLDLISYSSTPIVATNGQHEIRFAILFLSVLIFMWSALFLWRSKRPHEVALLPYLFLGCVLAFCYAYYYQQVGYTLALCSVAVCYHLLFRAKARLPRAFKGLPYHLNGLSLFLITLLPFIATPLTPIEIGFRAYKLSASFFFSSTKDMVAILFALLIGAALTISSVVYNIRTSTLADNAPWRWFLLLSGFLFSWAWAMVTLSLNVSPLWSFLVLTLLYVVCAVVLRRVTSARWANPVDVLVLNTSIVTILLSFNHTGNIIVGLFDFFAILSYGILLYQRRHRLLFVPFVFFLCTLPLVSVRLTMTLLVSLALPLVAVIIHRYFTARPIVSMEVSAVSSKQTIIWEWPLLAGALMYSIALFSVDVLRPISTVHYWLGVPFPVALELGVTAFAWYIAAALAREKWWLFIVTLFACTAVLLPMNEVAIMVWAAPALAICAFMIGRLSSGAWSVPFYIAAILAAIMIGINEYTQGQLLLATNALLVFAVVLYLLGVAEDFMLFLWLAAGFVVWSVFHTALTGNLYRAPIVALVCAVLGVAIGCLKYVFPRLRAAQGNTLFQRYSLPLYVTAMAAAMWSALYGTLVNVDAPFPTASPDIILLFTVVIFAVVLFERQPRWLFLVAIFGIWATCLAVGVNVYYVTCIGLITALLGFLCSRFVRIPLLPLKEVVAPPIDYALYKFSWGWPWYSMALVAAVSLGAWRFLPDIPTFAGFSEYALLGFALIAYTIGIAEEMLVWSWIGTLLAVWSLLYSAQVGDGYRLFSIALIGTTVGVMTQILNRSHPSLFVMTQRNRRVEYALPFYITALAAAVLTGIFSNKIGINTPFYGAIPSALLMYALIAYEVLLLERQPKWLALVAVLSAWGTLLAVQTNLGYVVAIGLCAGVIGLLLSRLVHQPGIATTSAPTLLKFSWGWPWYVTVLVAACFTGLWNTLVVSSASVLMIENSLLAFALLIYLIGLVEHMPSWSRLGAVMAAWSLVNAVLENDFYRLFVLALASGLAGIVLNYSDRGTLNKRFAGYRVPLYAVSLVATILTGVYGSMHLHTALLFYAAVPVALFSYVFLIYMIALVERKVPMQWFVLGFAMWATLLLTITPACISFVGNDTSTICQAQRQTTSLFVVIITTLMGILGLLIGRLIKQPIYEGKKNFFVEMKSNFTWNWSWYMATLFAIAVSTLWNSLVTSSLSLGFPYVVLYIFIALTVFILLVERVPELILVPLALTLFTISQLHWLFWQQIVACSLLFALVFAARSFWKVLPTKVHFFSPSTFHERLSLFGQVGIVLLVVQHGGLIQSGLVAHVGAFALLLLGVLLFCYGRSRTDQAVQRWCYYGAGLLVSLSASWELAAVQQTRIDVLTLAPASYLVVIAPFLARDASIKERHLLGQLCSIAGALLLLLPTLWSSFTHDNLQPTLILAGEALVLFIVGVSTRIRFFILSGAALVIVSAIHALFLPSLGIPPFLALAILGVALLGLATALKLVSPRIKVLWKEAE